MHVYHSLVLLRGKTQLERLVFVVLSSPEADCFAVAVGCLLLTLAPFSAERRLPLAASCTHTPFVSSVYSPASLQRQIGTELFPSISNVT